MNKKTLAKINKHNDEMSVSSSADRKNRARSITVGTAFGGVSELVIRTDGRYMFAVLQPTEVIELIHQLAANVGCHIHIQPRNDFASWRKWREVRPEASGANFPPFANNPPLFKEQQPGLQPALMARSESNEQTVATEKTVGRKRAKRAATAA